MRRCRPGLGTLVDITIDDDDRPSRATPAAAFAAIDRVQRLMSFHDAASDLARLNAGAHRDPVRVDPWTYDVLSIARTLFERSDGHFDCAVAPVLVDAGLLPRHGDGVVDRAATFDDVTLLPGHRVRFARRLLLDLGGIAKGYAVDRAIEALRERGIARAVVNAGGDLRVLGDIAVPIHVRRDGVLHAAGRLSDGAFATSACFRAGTNRAPGALIARDRTRVDDGRHHSVVAPTCVIADALTKVVASAGAASDRCLASFGATTVVH